jgi:glyoxylase I family protein
MQIIGVHHVALYTARYALMRDFYVDVLGMVEIGGFRGHPITFLAGHGVVIELCGDERPVEPRGQGWSHLAFEVADLDAAYAELSGRGITFHVPPEPYPPEAATVRTAFFRDPDGNELELIQPLGARYPAT